MLCVVPVFCVKQQASETWALTQEQIECLKCVHCQISKGRLNAWLSDRYGTMAIRVQCGTLCGNHAEHLAAAHLRWQGHIVCVEEGGGFHVFLSTALYGVDKRPEGAPPERWERVVHNTYWTYNSRALLHWI